MYLFDTEALAHALTLPCDPKLRRLLHERVDHLSTLDRAVADTTYFLIADGGVTSADIVAELGWSPVVDLEGARYGTDSFAASHDFIADRGGWFELMYSTSNEAVIVLLVMDDERSDADLLAFCRTYAEEAV